MVHGTLSWRLFHSPVKFKEEYVVAEASRNPVAAKNKVDKIDKGKALESALFQIEKQFGAGSIMRLGQKGAALNVPVISTSSLALDAALGIGGVPRGRVMEIYGPEASGKTTLALHIVAEAQKADGIVAFIDAEHALDPAYSRNLGVNIDELLISQPDSGEQALEIAETLVRSEAVDVVVVDSVAALVPRAELAGDMGDAQIGLQARLMSQALRKLTGAVSRSKTCLLFINQVRERIGGSPYSNPEVTTGGRALKFYASLRMEIRRIAAIKDGQNIIGARARVKVVKNKLAPPFKEAEFDIIYGAGINRLGDLLDTACKWNLVERVGSWFSYGETRLGQGRENAKRFMKENPKIIAELTKKMRDQIAAKARPS